MQPSNCASHAALAGSPPPIDTPAGARELSCPGCRSAANQAAKFCGQCGFRLWDPCLDCEHQNSVAEKFCGSCGSELAARLNGVLADAQSRFAEADRLAEFGRLVDAAALLDGLTLTAHSRLANLVTERDNRVAAYRERREAVVQQSSGVLEEVNRLIAAADYAAALAEADKIPPALRVAELAELHKQAAEKVERSNQLRAQLRAGVREKKYEGLLRVARLLAEVTPTDPLVEKLLPQLEQWQASADSRRATACVAGAVEALKNNAYRKAESLLAQSPPITDETLAKTYQAARERVWLATQIADAPYATKTLAAIATRLAKLQPNDQTAGRIAQQVSERAAKSAANPRGVPAPWGKDREPGPLGGSLEVCPLPPALVAACVQRKVAAHQVSVGYGLGLQALGGAALPLNLMPVEKKGWLKKLAAGRGRGASRGWGLDIGGRSLTAVCLESPANTGDPPAVGVIEVIPYGDDVQANTAPRDGGLAPAVQHALSQLAERHDLTQTPVVASLSGPKTLGRFFALPAPTPSKFDQAVEFEVRSGVPLPREYIVADYHAQVLPGEPDDVDDVPMRWVTLVAASRKLVAARMQSLVGLGWGQLAVGSSPIALLNTALSPGGAAADRAALGDGVALLDVSGGSTNLVMVTATQVWFRGIHFGADTMIAQIAKAMKIDQPAASKLYYRPESAAAMHTLHDALAPSYDELLGQLTRSLELCRADTGTRPNRVLVTGSETNAPGMLSHLRNGK
ncbi:double zinc ribbon domain-containing protein [Posidoniimonas polymericola]|nr:zinc ribbon domain-containing protein [Posidoniimonas polymericola]